MASAQTLDVEALLAPISETNPCGESLRWDPLFDEIGNARRQDSKDALDADDTARADWALVIEKAGHALAWRSKDLMLAAYLTEAAVELHGFPGLRDGLRVINGLLEQFWDSVFPLADGEDLEPRAAPLVWLTESDRGARLPNRIRDISLIPTVEGGPAYGWSFWKSSFAKPKGKNEDDDAYNRRRAQAEERAKLFENAVAAVTAEHYAHLRADLDECIAEVRRLDAVLDRRFGRAAARALQIQQALEDIAALVAGILNDKGWVEASADGAPATGAVVQGAPAATAPGPPYLDENVQFTVYRPQVVQPERWYSMLAFAHLSERRPDTEEREPDPIEEVERQARQILGEQFDAYRDVSEDSAHAIPREGELTFVPQMEGVEFNPKARSFLWDEPVHREEFRLRASRAVDGRTVRGSLTVFLGHILLAEVSIGIRVVSQPRATVTPLPPQRDRAVPYRKIFPSYSHKDAAIVVQFERYAAALGDEYLRDVTHLRAGEVWNKRLQALIREADVFQLFWSWNSMRSPFVGDEWQYALSLDRERFVRPTYWEEPLPSAPAENLPPEVLQRLHFQRIVTAASGRSVDAAASGGQAEAPPPQAPVSGVPPSARAPAPRRRVRTLASAAGVALLVGTVALFTHVYEPPPGRTAAPTRETMSEPVARVLSEALRERPLEFDHGRSDIPPGAVARLDEAVRLLNQSGHGTIVVEGEVDPTEADDAALAARRAGAVRDYLVRNGIAADRIRVKSRGATGLPPGSPPRPAHAPRVELRVE
jgi:type VI secretion system protein ImpA